MRLPKFNYIAPTSVKEACALLDEHGAYAKILGGGTDLLVAMKLNNVQPAYLISLKGIDELKGITFKAGEGLKMGAMTPLYQIRHDPKIKEQYQALAQAAASVGSPQIQRMGTLGGNICLNTRCYFYNQSSAWRKHRPVCLKMGGDVCHVVPKGKRCYGVFSADTPAALIALEAKIGLASSKGTRWVLLRDLYTGDGKEPIALNQGEIVTHIQLPPVNEEASIYLKHRIRKAIDFPLVGVAARMVWNGKKDTCLRAKVIVNAVASAPVEVSEAEALLKGSILSREVIAKAGEMAVRISHPVANVDSTPTHRREMAGSLTQRALKALIN